MEWLWVGLIFAGWLAAFVADLRLAAREDEDLWSAYPDLQALRKTPDAPAGRSEGDHS